ncbi:MAG: protein kinase domain-containing protein [Myxococcota bacterium]
MLERIEKYRILEEIGQGGMSVVYRGHDEYLDRDVAVKVMHRHLARDPDARERFSREARAVARLTHHNIPEIYDYSSSRDDLNYLVTELVEGAPLSALLREGEPVLPEIGAMVVVGVAEALAHAHRHDIVHRDVKPENILVGRDGVVKLTDFGIAQIVGLESMTITGTLVGSPAHMSPEQIEGDGVLDRRADVWALGTVLYAAATGGSLPFDAPTPHGILKRIVEGRYDDPRRINPHVNSGLSEIIGRCLQVDPERRYATVEALAEDLREWLARRGLTHMEAELRSWMTDRRGYQRSLSERLVGAMLSLGDLEWTEGRRHLALEAYGRVLTLDPDNTEALERLRELHSGLRRRRLLTILLALLVVGGAGGGLWSAWPLLNGGGAAQPGTGRVLTPTSVPREPPRFEAPEPVVPSPPPTDAGLVAGRAIADVTVRAGALARPRARPVRKVVRERPRRVRRPDPEPETLPVLLTVEPPAVKLSVDGQPVKPGGDLRLTPGTHRAILTHPGCPGCDPKIVRFEVEDGPGDRPVRRHLQFEYPPAVVEIECEGGEVSIDGEVYGPCGTPYVVPVRSHSPKVGRITVTFDDGHVWKRQFVIKPKARVHQVAE